MIFSWNLKKIDEVLPNPMLKEQDIKPIMKIEPNKTVSEKLQEELEPLPS